MDTGHQRGELGTFCGGKMPKLALDADLRSSSGMIIMSLETTVQSTMEQDLRTGLSVWAIIAIVCNSVVGVLILILFGIIYKACKVPSHQEKVLVFTAMPENKKKKEKAEQKNLLTEA